jgi:hypothetical protein
MAQVIDQANWSTFLKEYSERNEGKPTRIGVFEVGEGFSNDYWIEDGLPLVGLDAYPDRDKKRIDILFENYTHSIDDVAEVRCIDGPVNDQGLDIADKHGRITHLRFEDWLPKSEEESNG